MKTLILLFFSIQSVAMAAPRAELDKQAAYERIMKVSEQLPGDDWDESEICTSPALVKKYDLKRDCKVLGF